ncbi:MAG: PhoX family phosphatase [Candidatus Pelagadaptatus aseana]|uniref:PhoX family protein n=1 Tax=Candidatus Pelagadaptatus aseana TaxID=3120508 RepID=UPI0039B2B3CC
MAADREPLGFDQVMEQALSRRNLIRLGAVSGAAGFLAGTPLQVLATVSDLPESTLMGFTPVAASTEDRVLLPEGYRYDLLISWGDPILKDAPEFSLTNTATDQAGQFGDNTDGMSLFPLLEADGSLVHDRALMAVNNEYVNRRFLHVHGGSGMDAEAVNKEINAHGVSIFEVQRDSRQQWSVVQGSRYNRRLHGQTAAFAMAGPAAGCHWLKTHSDPTGVQVRGTLNNCGCGQTPWGTYLTCEENFNNYFGAPADHKVNREQRAYGIKAGSGYFDWWQHQSRFDFSREPNEANRFGWVVEIDPYAPDSTAKKRTALGRFKHENAALTLNRDGRAVVYMGDDERGEFIYKYVSDEPYIEGDRQHNLTLLDKGTLYAARFYDDGRGEWLELTHGKNGLTAANGFPDQNYILVFARLAARHVGATTMDRPEWVACHPSLPMVMCTLTNNKHRGVKDQHPLNGVNPRVNNRFGQIVRWLPVDGDHGSVDFHWDLYALAGNPQVFKDEYAGSDNITADNMFNSPDGLAFDRAGRLWIQTDGNVSNEGAFAGMGNNQMLVSDPATGEIRRFLTGPVGCEITGLCFSGDQRTLFVGIQHPTKRWPSAEQDGVPRSTVIAIQREDGGVIGA